MQKRILYFFAILLIILSYILDFLAIGRLVILIMGILLIDIQVTKNHPQKIILLLFLPIILLVLTYGMDILLVTKFNKTPVFSYEIKSNEKIKTYNSFFYRVYSCNNNLVMDYGYNLKYPCDSNDLEEHEINAFMGEITASFSKYHHKFVKLQGKISKISGVNILELSPYVEDNKNTLNGYVEFNTEYVIRINTQSDLSKFRIYDEVTVIGLVNNLTKEKPVVIDLIDPVIIPSTIYDNYSLEVIENDRKTIENYVEKNNIYLLGLTDIFVHYDAKHIYELKYLITDERLKIENLINDTKASELKDENDNLGAYTYKLAKFNIVSCQNGKTIIVNKNRQMTLDLCHD